jgi:hypothetical protein
MFMDNSYVYSSSQTHFSLYLLQVNNTMTVDGIDYYVTTNYGEELYNSCKDLKFGSQSTRARLYLLPN